MAAAASLLKKKKLNAPYKLYNMLINFINFITWKCSREKIESAIYTLLINLKISWDLIADLATIYILISWFSLISNLKIKKMFANF